MQVHCYLGLKVNQFRFILGLLKRILRYIQGSLDFGILYEINVKPKLVGFCDSDWAGSMDDMKSTSGYAYLLCTGVFS